MYYKVTQNSELLMFLINYINISKKEAKHLLTNGCVYVNNKIEKQYNFLLHKNDEIYIIKNYIFHKKKQKIEIIYEDRELIVVNKPHNLLTIATAKEKDNTLYKIVSEYVKKSNKNNKIFIVHRLDKDTSGIILFTKNQKLKYLLQNKWNQFALKREYLAKVHGIINKNQTLKNYLAIDKYNNTYISNQKQGKIAITEFKIIKKYKNTTLLSLEIKTGRKNQIRIQLANINHPIIGDKRFGIKDKSSVMLLHAYKLEIIHPITNKILKFKTQYPPDFI